MRIAEISTLARPVPPSGEGSVESLVHGITEELVRRGHDVTLYATKDSQTSAKLRSPVENSYCESPEMWDWQLWEAYNVSEAFRHADKYDVIHCHSYYHGLMFAKFANIPSLHSIHIQPGPDYRFLAERAPNAQVICCSQYQATVFEGLTNVSIIPHGIPLDNFKSETPEDYVLFLGRFMPEKGPLEAIQAARKAGVKIKLAAPENEYFQESILPLVDNDSVIYVGEASASEKATLLSKARAIVYPVQDGEPFGLVLIEALASGVPVVALNRGAVPEIITHDKTGFLCESIDEMASQIQSVSKLDRDAIRVEAVNRFSTTHMVDELESLMHELVSQGKRE